MVPASSERSRRRIRGAAVTALAGAVTFIAPLAAGSRVQSRANERIGRPRPAVAFEANAGETDPQVRLLARAPGYTMFLGEHSATLALNGVSHPLTLAFAGASGSATVRGDQPRTATTYFAQRGTGELLSAAHFERARYDGLYPGIAAVFHGDRDRIQFDFEVAPGGDPAAIALSFGGADTVSVARSGELVIAIDGATVRLKRPFIYQDAGGARRQVRGGFVLRDGQVGFHVGGYDRSRPLVIDPTIEYATYLGSPGNERIVSIAADAAGDAYVFGATTDRLDFPTTSAVGRLTGVPEYCFVSKFDATGSNLLYSVVYLDSASVTGSPVLCDAMALAPTGLVHTVFQSVDGTFVKTLRTLDDSVAPVKSSSVLLTALEGFRPVQSVAADASGYIYVVGACFNGRVQTPSPYPYPGGFRTTPSSGRCVTQDNFFSLGQSESVLVKYDSLGHLQYGTFLTNLPDADPAAMALAVDGNGHAYVGGRTTSRLLPTTSSAYSAACTTDATAVGCNDAFLMAIDTTNSGPASLTSGSYFGGSGFDAIDGIAVDAQGRVTVVGETTSPDLPGPSGPLDGSGGAYFLARFDLSQSGSDQLLVNTALATGQAFRGMPPRLALASDASVSIAGMWASAPFPSVSGLLDATPSASQPLPFLTTFAPDLSSILFSTLLDGTASRDPHAVSLTPDAVLAVEVTSNSDRATAGAFQTAPAGGDDLLLMKIDGVRGVNHPPTLQDLSPVERGADSPAGATVYLFAQANDPDNDPLTVTFTGPLGPVSGTPGSSGLYSAPVPFPIGASTVTVTVSDGRGGSASASANVTVVGAVTAGTGTVVVHPAVLLDLGEPLPEFAPPATLTIENAAGGGVTTMNIRTNIGTPAVPDGLQMPSPPYYYELHTTVPGAGPYTLCLDTTGMSLGDRASLRLYFHDGTAWHDISGASTGATFCGQTATLDGTFALMTQAAAWNVATTIAGPHDPGTGLDLGLFGGTAIDTAGGSLYITTYGALNRVNLTTGAIAHVAGDDVIGTFQVDTDGSFGIPSPSGVPATSVHLTNPHQIALDATGNLYVAEFCQVRRIGTDGIITNIAGDGFCRTRGDGGPATAASLNGSVALAFDAAGGLLVSEFTGRIRRIDAAGVIASVAGNGTSTIIPGPALQSGFGTAARIAVAPNGDVYVAAQSSQLLRISAGANRTLDDSSQISVINTCALTTCVPLPYGGDGGPVAAATFQTIESIAVAANGDVLVGDNSDPRIRRIAAGADHVVTGLDADEIITTVAGFNPTATVAGQNAGQGYYLQGEGFGLSAAAVRVIDVLPDGTGGFFFVTGLLNEVRHVGAVQAPQSADVQLFASAPTRVPLNGTADATLIIRNLGPDDAAGTTVTISVDPALEIAAVDDRLGSCQFPATLHPAQVSCDAGTLASGGAARLVVSLRGLTAGATARARFDVSSAVPDPAMANNHAEGSFQVNTPPVAIAGGPYSALATSADGGVVHVAGIGSDADNDPLTFTWSENGVTLATSAAADILLSAGMHTLTLTVRDLLNQTQDTATAIVQPITDLVLTAALANPDAGAHAGVPLDFAVELTNHGPFAAATAAVQLSVPTGLQFNSASPQGACSVAANVLTCAVTDFHVRGTSDFTVTLTPTALGPLTAVFTAASANADPSPGNNSASVTINPDVLIAETIHVTDTITNPDVDLQEAITVTDTVAATVPDTIPPVVTLPANISVHLTEAGGARGDVPDSGASNLIHVFLLGGSATDDTDPAPARLDPTLSDGTVATDTTLFPVGLTLVTFRYRDAAGNIGSEVASVTVVNSFGTSITRPGVLLPLVDSAGNATPVALSISAILQAGLATADIVQASRPLGSYVALSPVYDVVTTALMPPSTAIDILIGGTFPADAVMLHDDGTGWREVTIACATPGVGVCGRVFSLSPFVVAKRSDTQPPIVTAPPAITVPATTASGASGADSPALAAFLAGGSATDNLDAAPTRLAPLVNGNPIAASTVLPLGTTTVTFRFRDAAGNVGSATSTVTVIVGRPDVDVRVAGEGTVSGTRKYIDLILVNDGDGNARNVFLDLALPIPLKGLGIVRLLQPSLPLKVGDLDAGASTRIRVVVDVPPAVKELALIVAGHFQNVKGQLGLLAATLKITP